LISTVYTSRFKICYYNYAHCQSDCNTMLRNTITVHSTSIKGFNSYIYVHSCDRGCLYSSSNTCQGSVLHHIKSLCFIWDNCWELFYTSAVFKFCMFYCYDFFSFNFPFRANDLILIVHVCIGVPLEYHLYSFCLQRFYFKSC
jgi:hypothetical protein